MLGKKMREGFKFFLIVKSCFEGQLRGFVSDDSCLLVWGCFLLAPALLACPSPPTMREASLCVLAAAVASANAWIALGPITDGTIELFEVGNDGEAVLWSWLASHAKPHLPQPDPTCAFPVREHDNVLF